MPQIQLEDRIFQAAQRRATAEGYASVEAYIADVVVNDLAEAQSGTTPDFDHLFTPERIAELDQISADIRAGEKTYTTAEVREYFANRRGEWLKNHQS